MVAGFTISAVAPFRHSVGKVQVPRESIVSLLAGQDDDEEELVRVPRRNRRGRFYEDRESEEAFYDSVERRIYGQSDDIEDDEDEDLDDDDDEEEYGIFSNVLIDNPILDRIDPDGAAERFPELAKDPRFWIDMFLFIAFLDWLSAIGPQNYFRDLPYFV